MEKIAFLGLGIMGHNIVVNLLKAGYSVTVYNRTAAKTKPLVDLGAKKAATPREAASGADVVMVMVNDDKGIEDVFFGKDGVESGDRKSVV